LGCDKHPSCPTGDDFILTDQAIFNSAFEGGQELVADFSVILQGFLEERLLPWVSVIIETGNDPTPVVEAFAEILHYLWECARVGFPREVPR